MVRRLAWHVHGGGRPGIELEDLMQAGMVALTEAAQRHSGPGEDGFAAYAKLRVRGAMVDLIRREVPLSRGGVERRRHLREAESALRLELGRDPSSAQLAQALGISPADLAAWQSSSAPLRFDSLDETYSDSNMAFADDRPDSLELLAGEEMREQVAAAIAALPDRLQLIVQLYFVEELNLSEIAETLQVSVPRVHQLKAQAIDKLRAALAEIAEVI
jgi:RNA polymerase sigma factor for flagellar operon FliA